MPPIKPELLDELLPGVPGDGGVFRQLKKVLMERALSAELTHHHGYEKGTAPGGRARGNSRNGHSAKTVLIRQAIGGSLLVTNAAISGNDRDGRMCGQPRGHRRGLAIGQNVDEPSPLQITIDCPVAMTSLPGQVVDANHPRFRGWLGGMAADDAK